MIVATAGHVDHGKTSLVHALTGVDTDRLEEEKRRGLSISLGYAYLPTTNGLPVGFIDVPGHQRFINNMICGISGIDMGLLLVAADDGVMPQTLEHLDVLHLLGVRQLVLAISKIDRVSDQRLQEVRDQALALCAARQWQDTPVFPVNSIDGQGIEPLQHYILQYADECQTRASGGCFRMSIDRAFTVKGAGVVVTGTVATGKLRLDESLRLTPANTAVRVRGLRVHDAEASQALAGQRCAINISGDVELQDIDRGNVLVAAHAGPVSDKLDVSLQLLASLPFSVKHMTQVRLHIGAARIGAKLALFEPGPSGHRLTAGREAFAQLLLDTPIASTRLERFVLRDSSGQALLGGGQVINPYGEKPPRNKRPYLEQVAALALPDAGEALAALLQLDREVDIGAFEWICNLLPGEIDHLVPGTVHRYTSSKGSWAASQYLWQAAGQAIVEHLADYHREHPAERGLRAALLSRAIKNRYSASLVHAVLAGLVQKNTVQLKDGLLCLTDFKARAVPELDIAWRKVAALLESGDNNILLFSELQDQSGFSRKQLQQLLADAVRKKRLYQVSERRHALPAQLKRLCQQLLEHDAAGEDISVIAMKGRWGTGRNITVEILEYFDRIRFTQRRDNVRVVINRALPETLFSG